MNRTGMAQYTQSTQLITSLNSCLENRISANTITSNPLLAPDWGECFTLKDVLTPEECKNFINAATEIGYSQADPAYPPSYRNNSRLVVDDQALAQSLFQRIHAYLPDPLIDADGTIWRPIGLNERFRFCYYQSGEFFKIHRDGVYFRNSQQLSRLTFMIYLNEGNEFENGATRFFPSSDANSKPLISVTPETGMLIIFDHRLWHDGEPVSRGKKYIMRSDILYEKQLHPQRRISEKINSHAGYVWALHELDKGIIASGGRDKTVRIWQRDGNSLACRQVLKGHSHSVTALTTMSSDQLWSGSRDQSIYIWQMGEDGFEISKKITAHEGAILSLTKISEDLIASGSADNQIHIWDQNGKCQSKLIGHSSWVWDIKAIDQDTLISASEDGTIRVWDLTNQSNILTINNGGGPARCLALLDNGNLVACGSADGVVRIWQLQKRDNTYSLNIKQQLNGHSAEIRALCELSDGILASGGEDNLIRIWNLADGSILNTLHHNDFVTALNKLEGGALISASYDGTIKIWNI